MARKHVRKAAERKYAYSCGSTHVMVLHCIVCVSHKFVQERRNWLGRKDLQEVEAPPTLLTGAHVRRVSKFHAAQPKRKKKKEKEKKRNVCVGKTNAPTQPLITITYSGPLVSCASDTRTRVSFCTTSALSIQWVDKLHCAVS